MKIDNKSIRIKTTKPVDNSGKKKMDMDKYWEKMGLPVKYYSR